MPKGQSPIHLLALWFWKNILERQEDPWASAGFPRYLAEAKRALKQYNADPALLKIAIIAMRSAGIEVKSIHLPFLFPHHFNGPNWYEWIEQQGKTPPHVSDTHAYIQWAKEHRPELLDWLEQ